MSPNAHCHLPLCLSFICTLKMRLQRRPSPNQQASHLPSQVMNDEGVSFSPRVNHTPHRLFHRVPLLLKFHFVSLIVGSLCLPLMMLEHYVSCKVFYRPGSIYNGAFEKPISAVLAAPCLLLQIDADCNRLQSTFAALLLLLVSIKSRMRLQSL